MASDRVLWSYRGRAHSLSRKAAKKCPLCGAKAVVALPAAILAEQPDATTHVCHPLLGGCNHGFEQTVTITEVKP